MYARFQLCVCVLASLGIGSLTNSPGFLPALRFFPLFLFLFGPHCSLSGRWELRLTSSLTLVNPVPRFCGADSPSIRRSFLTNAPGFFFLRVASSALVYAWSVFCSMGSARFPRPPYQVSRMLRNSTSGNARPFAYGG